MRSTDLGVVCFVVNPRVLSPTELIFFIYFFSNFTPPTLHRNFFRFTPPPPQDAPAAAEAASKAKPKLTPEQIAARAKRGQMLKEVWGGVNDWGKWVGISSSRLFQNFSIGVFQGHTDCFSTSKSLTNLSILTPPKARALKVKQKQERNRLAAEKRRQKKLEKEQLEKQKKQEEAEAETEEMKRKRLKKEKRRRQRRRERKRLKKEAEKNQPKRSRRLKSKGDVFVQEGESDYHTSDGEDVRGLD